MWIFLAVLFKRTSQTTKRYTIWVLRWGFHFRKMIFNRLDCIKKIFVACSTFNRVFFKLNKLVCFGCSFGFTKFLASPLFFFFYFVLSASKIKSCLGWIFLIYLFKFAKVLYHTKWRKNIRWILKKIKKYEWKKEKEQNMERRG